MMESVDFIDRHLDPPDMPEWDGDRLWDEIAEALTDEQYEFIQYELESEQRMKRIQVGINTRLQDKLDKIIDRCEHGVVSPDIILELAQGNK